MTTTKLSTKGQLIIPKEIRDRHGWEAGTELEVLDRGDAVIVRLPLELPVTEVEDLVGCTGYRGPRRSLTEMEEGVRTGAQSRR